MQREHVIVTSTIDSAEAARALADGLIAAKLGACAQIVGPITSVYRWQGEVRAEHEWRVEVKTTSDRVEALVAHIKANHGYDLPEIIATPINGGSEDYLAWVRAESRD